MLQIPHLQKTSNCTSQSQDLQLDGSKINRWKSSSFPSNTSSPSYFISTMLGLIEQLTVLLAVSTAANTQTHSFTQPQGQGMTTPKGVWVKSADLESKGCPVLWWVFFNMRFKSKEINYVGYLKMPFTKTYLCSATHRQTTTKVGMRAEDNLASNLLSSITLLKSLLSTAQTELYFC